MSGSRWEPGTVYESYYDAHNGGLANLTTLLLSIKGGEAYGRGSINVMNIETTNGVTIKPLNRNDNEYQATGIWQYNNYTQVLLSLGGEVIYSNYQVACRLIHKDTGSHIDWPYQGRVDQATVYGINKLLSRVVTGQDSWR